MAAEDQEELIQDTDNIEKHWWSTYKEYYNNDSTKQWMQESAQALVDRCGGQAFEWQSYDNARMFAKLEDAVAQNLFGVNEQLAQRAVNANNVLAGYNCSQRRIARDIRQKLEKIGKQVLENGGQKIEMQVVPFFLRSDDDVRAGKTNSRSACVFRVKCREDLTKCMLVDGSARSYESWDYFLKNNSIPMAMMCSTPDGFLRDNGARVYTVDEMKFCETPACSLGNRSLSWLATGCAWLSPVATIGLFWTPVGWIGMGLNAVTIFVTSYGLISQGSTIYDKYHHDESYAIDLFHFISTIGTFVIQKALPKYLKSVAKARDELTQFERCVITAFLSGMGASQVLSFIGMLYSFATKQGPTTALDILNLVVACQNMYCCIISPKTAEGMLNQVRGELANEEIRKMTEEQAKEAKLKTEISELERRAAHPREGDNVEEIRAEIREKHKNLETCVEAQKHHQEEFQSFKSKELEKAYLKKRELSKLQTDLNDLQLQLDAIDENGPEADRIGAKMQRKQDAFNDCEQEIIRYQEKHQQAVKAKMKDTGAQKKYQQFLNDETNRESPRQQIDQNGRIVQAMFEMDAELVFKLAADTGSEIRFTNGETLHLAINNEFDIHPRAFEQMNQQYSGENKKTDLQKVFELTKNPPGDYLSQIKTVLQPYRMITRTQISDFRSQMRSALGAAEGVETRFDDLSAAEAFRLRGVMNDIKGKSKGCAIRAAQQLVEKLHYDSDSFRLADCVEIIKLEANKKSSQITKEKQSLRNDNETEDAAMERICRARLQASDEDITRLRTRKFGKDAIKEMCYEKVGLDGNVNQLATYVEERMVILERRFFDEDICLPFSHPLSAVYHIMKHGKDVDPNGILTPNHRDDAYFYTVPEDFFASGVFTSNENTSVSQNGMTINRTWRNNKNYFGVTGAPYTYDDDPFAQNHADTTSLRYIKKIAKKLPNLYVNRFPGERIKTHFQK